MAAMVRPSEGAVKARGREAISGFFARESGKVAMSLAVH
jgi:hypothetical protein